jgi:hypothetical protein
MGTPKTSTITLHNQKHRQKTQSPSKTLQPKQPRISKRIHSTIQPQRRIQKRTMLRLRQIHPNPQHTMEQTNLLPTPKTTQNPTRKRHKRNNSKQHKKTCNRNLYLKRNRTQTNRTRKTHSKKFGLKQRNNLPRNSKTRNTKSLKNKTPNPQHAQQPNRNQKPINQRKNMGKMVKQHLRKTFQTLPKQNRQKTTKTSNQNNQTLRPTPLFRNHAIQRNKRHPIRQTTTRTQQHQKHTHLHTTTNGRTNRKLHLQNIRQPKKRQRTHRNWIRIHNRKKRTKILQKKEVTLPSPLFFLQIQKQRLITPLLLTTKSPTQISSPQTRQTKKFFIIKRLKRLSSIT